MPKIVFDFAPFSGDREITDEGYLATNVIATAVGIQEYDARELGGDKPGKVSLHRTPETVFHKDTITSFSGRPVTIGHDGDMIDVNTHKMFSCGNVMGDAFKINDKELGVRVLITDPDVIRRILDNELTGVSLGYMFNHVFSVGDFKGAKFDAITDGPMQINHVTLLPDSMPPRVKEARILDAKQEDFSMDEETKAEVQALIDASIVAALAAADAKDMPEEEKTEDADPEEKAEDKADDAADADKDDDEAKDKADEPEKMSDAAFAARVRDAANKRARVLKLCGIDAITDKDDSALLKTKLGAKYINDDHAIGYLTAATDAETTRRGSVGDSFKGTGTASARIHSINDIKKLGKGAA